MDLDLTKLAIEDKNETVAEYHPAEDTAVQEFYPEILEEAPKTKKTQIGEYECIPILSQSQPGSSRQAPECSAGSSSQVYEYSAESLGQASDCSEDTSSQTSDSSTDMLKASSPSTSVSKRNRGRPTLKSLQHAIPQRASRRRKKNPNKLTYFSFKSKSPNHWTEKDKQSFLEGCMTVGIQDIEALKKYLPHKTKNEIKSQIAMWKRLAARRIERCMADNKKINGVKPQIIKNLNDWIDFFSSIADTRDNGVLRHYFSILSEYGEFPTPKECGGIDYRAMFRYMHYMINGLPPIGLDPVTARALLKFQDEVFEKLNKPDNFYETQDLLEDAFNNYRSRSAKDYSRQGAAAATIDKIVSSRTLNPLKLPKEALIMSDSESD